MGVNIPYIFAIPSIETFYNRTIATLLASQDFFLASFSWVGFSLLGEVTFGLNTMDGRFWFLTGFGTALGMFISQLITINFYLDLTPSEKLADIHRAAVVAFGTGFATGTLWQVSVNISLGEDFDFTAAFFFVFSMSAVAFFIGVFFVREINDLMVPTEKKLEIDSVYLATWHDFLLAISVGCADAFFIGTDNGEYRGGWLADFSVSSKQSALFNMFIGGVSSTCGFLICQTIQNIIFHDVWCDYQFKSSQTPVTIAPAYHDLDPSPVDIDDVIDKTDDTKEKNYGQIL